MHKYSYNKQFTINLFAKNYNTIILYTITRGVLAMLVPFQMHRQGRDKHTYTDKDTDKDTVACLGTGC